MGRVEAGLWAGDEFHEGTRVFGVVRGEEQAAFREGVLGKHIDRNQIKYISLAGAPSSYQKRTLRGWPWASRGAMLRKLIPPTCSVRPATHMGQGTRSWAMASSPAISEAPCIPLHSLSRWMYSPFGVA